MRKKGNLARLILAAGLSAMLLSSSAFAEEAAAPEGTYFSELTGEPTDLSIENQRPIAVMVDNESLAYPHYGTTNADVVYELMNSTANGRITRLMALVKDWNSLDRIGSIRSVRPTNILLAAEWNAMLCHDGGPFYVDSYFAQPYASQHFSGGFSRIPNGKSYEYTEYVTGADLAQKFGATGYSTTYNEYAPEREQHFSFVPYGTEKTLSESYSNAQRAMLTILPFPHTSSTLSYSNETGEYEYSSYGQLYRDAANQETLQFKNVILQDCSFTLLDSNGYMTYNCVADGRPGYYLTNGEAIPITWTKSSETGITKYYDENGQELTINRGRTYISLIPEDTWESLEIH